MRASNDDREARGVADAETQLTDRSLEGSGVNHARPDPSLHPIGKPRHRLVYHSSQ
jgi:hypothetical protein